MNKNTNIVKLPQMNVNDPVATLAEWYVSDKDVVKKGDAICSVETSKAVVDIEANFDGHIITLVSTGQELSVLSPIALIGNSLESLEEEKGNYISPELRNNFDRPSKDGVRATKKAELLAQKHDIDLSRVVVKGIIKEKDVISYKEKFQPPHKTESYLDGIKLESSSKLFGNRKVGKDLMLESVNNIPQSYVEVVMETNDLIKIIKNYVNKTGQMISFLSIIISALGKTLGNNKVFNGYREGNTIYTYHDINIGVVLSHDGSVSILTIRNAPLLNPSEIAKELIKIRKSLLKKKPNIKDLIGATFTVSALDHTEITRFIPIIHPKQAAILAIPKIQFSNQPNQKITSKKGFLNLGLSFDHSFLDAMQASKFLEDLVKNFNDVVVELR